MSHPRRFTIFSLMACITALAIAIAALRHPSPLWANTLFTLADVVLTLAVLSAVFRAGRRRAFRIGFAACGWAYMIAVFAPWLSDNINPKLLTTAALDILYPYVVVSASHSPTNGSYEEAMGEFVITSSSTMPDAMSSRYLPDESGSWDSWTRIDLDRRLSEGPVLIVSSASFRQIGHALMAQLLAFLGGCFAQQAYEAGRCEA